MIKKLLFLIFLLYQTFTLTEAFANTAVASLQADNISYSRDYESITASGGAQLFFEGKKLFAFKIFYLKKEKKIIATGGVIFQDSNGDTYDFDYLTSDLWFNKIYATNIKGRSKKVLTWFAEEGLINQSHKKVKNFIFSPCVNCSNDIIKDKLLWKIRAEELEIDDISNEIILKKATLDFLDRPILYLPYVCLPYSKSKSGFLKPNFDMSREIGIRMELPYYFRLAPNMDVTLTPIILNTTIPKSYKLKFRHLLENGQYQVDGSFVSQKNSKQERVLNSNIKVDGDFKGRLFGRNINYGIHINKLFNESKTYLKKHRLSNEHILNSCMYVNNQSINHTGKSHFVSLETVSFQDLRLNYNTEITTLNSIPLIRYKQLYPIEFMNTKMELNSAFYNIITRSKDHDIRLINDINFSNQIVTSEGHEFNIKNGIYAYLHQCNDINEINKKYINFINIIPYSQIKWGYEMLASDYKDRIIIEPFAALMFTSDKFFSQETELLEIRKSNFFTPNRFLDWESSDLVSRFDYGLNFFLKNASIDALNIFLGSSLYIKKNQLANKKKYNYILDSSLQLNQSTFLVNRMCFSQRSFKIVRHEIDSIMKFNKLDLRLSYTYNSQIDDRLLHQDASGYIDFNFYQKWWLHIDAKVKLNSQKFSASSGIENKRKLLRNGIGLTYKDDCLKVDFAINRDHTKLKNLNPSVTYVIKIGVPIFSKLL